MPTVMLADQVRPGSGKDVLAELERRLGEARGAVIAVPGSLRISQAAEDAFAALIGDWDPMHNDPAWRTMAGDGPIVLGFHTLARIENDLRTCALLAEAAEAVRTRTAGLGNVRFPSPFPVGATARAEITVTDVTRHGSVLALTSTHRYGIDGVPNPVMVAELHSVLTAADDDPPAGLPQSLRDQAGEAPTLLRDVPGGKPVAPSPHHDGAFYDRLAERRGQWLGSTPWTSISDREAHAFALLAGDDGARPGADLRARAHPFLGTCIPPLQLLALRAYFSPLVGLPVLTDESMMAFNYGVDRARWHGSVLAGTRLRDHVQLLDVQARRRGDYLVTTRHLMEAEGEDVAALAADCKTLYRTSS